MLINSFSYYSRVLLSLCPLLVDRDYRRSIRVFNIILIGFHHKHRVVRTNSRVILDIESSPLIATYLRILVRTLIDIIANIANTVYAVVSRTPLLVHILVNTHWLVHKYRISRPRTARQSQDFWNKPSTLKWFLYHIVAPPGVIKITSKATATIYIFVSTTQPIPAIGSHVKVRKADIIAIDTHVKNS